jgi:PAS domain S-box-containing protein
VRIVSSKFYYIVGILTLLVLIGAFILGLMSANKMREIISEQFNQQQLVIAKSVATNIEDQFNFFKKEIQVLNLSPIIQYVEVSWPSLLKNAMDNMASHGVFEIGLVEASGKRIYRLTAEKRSEVIEKPYSDFGWLKWAQQPDNRNKIFLQRVQADLQQGKEINSFLLMVIPTYQISTDESHPVASGKFFGALYFLLDPSLFVKKFSQGIQSGQTGYAWVIDREGNFLYHPENYFIGENAFEVRGKRSQTISFSEINKIQRERMLAGEEGVSWYWSGWHRGLEQKMKKFIAYAPITLIGGNDRLMWSVAVVAPQSEVEDVIHEAYIRQFLLQGLVILAIMLGGGTVLFYENRWSAALKDEVDRKTAALKKSNDELAKSEKSYKSLVESAEDSILTVDPHNEVISINRFGAKFFGYTPMGIIGKSITAIFPRAAGHELAQQIEQVFSSKTGCRIPLQVEINGTAYSLNVNLTPLRENDHISSVLVMAHDVSMSKKIEEQMYHTEKLASLGQLSAGVAHEINNPLAIILGYLDMLLEKTDEKTQEFKILKTIERQGNNCKKIVENLMTFARMPDGVEYDTDVNLNIEMVLDVVKNMLFTSKVSYTLDLEENLPLVRGDATQLQQVFLNLITNAVKAMTDGGKLTITSRSLQKENKVQILFADTGVGIKKEHLPKIFDPFFTTRKVGEGTGLGLSVSYAIITKFSGTIVCNSKAKDEEGIDKESGTTFTITLPISNQAIKEKTNLEG